MIYYIASRFDLPEKFEDCIYLSQITQAECIEDATAHWRRNKGRCNGALYWQFNDCWPVCSWSSYDYYGNYKALQYSARNFNAPLGVSVENDENKIDIYVINDLNSEQKVTLEAAVFEINGGEKYRKSTAVTLDRLENKLVYSFDARELDKSGDAVLIRLIKDGKALLQKTVLLDREKNLKLPKAKISVNFERDGQLLKIYLKSDKFARLVRLESKTAEEPFSDNYFDLMPGEIKQVTVKIPDGTALEDFQNGIGIMSLCDVKKDRSKLKVLKNKVKIFTSPINLGNAAFHGKIPADIKIEE